MDVTYIYSRLLLGFLVVSTSSYSALIHDASQTPYQLQATAPIFANSSLRCIGDFLTRSFQVRHLLGCAGSGLPSLGLPVLLPNQGVLVVLQDQKVSSSYCRIQRGPRRNAGFSVVT